MCCFSLGRIGQDSKPALPKLKTLLSDGSPEVRLCVSRAICEIDPSSILPVSALVKDSSHPDVAIRVRAIIILGEIGMNDKRVVPAILKGCRDEHSIVRSTAVRTLGKLSPTDASTISALEVLLGDEDATIRRDAESVLQMIKKRREEERKRNENKEQNQ